MSDRTRAAELSLAEGLMDLPIADLSETGLDVRGYEARVLKTSKSRPILRYATTCFDKEKNALIQRVIIGKGYFRHDGARTFEAMKLLWEEGFAEDHLLAIPEPIAYVPRVKLLLQGCAPGDALYTYLDDPEEALEPVCLTARWLAKLHGTGIAGAPVLPLDYEETKLRTYGEVLMQLCPPFASRIERFVRDILALLGAPDPREVVPTHGDFQPKNISIFRDRVTVIDFDRFALAHPARDLGHFIGQSMTMSYARTGSFEKIKPWNHAFLEEYIRLASPEVLSVVPVFVARTFMEVLKHKIFLDPAKNSHLLPAWLDECERWLDGTRLREREPVSGERENKELEGRQMTQATTIEEVKQQLTQSMEMVRRPEYLDAEVRPYLEAENGANGNWETRVLQLDGTGAATLEMNLNGERIFGKFFPDDSGPFVYEKLKALRTAGFGSGERYQIVEPLSFTPEYRMLLTRGVEGSAVSEFIGVDDDAVLSGVEEAARWLAKLHTSPIRFGKPRYLLESSELLSVTRRLAKVVLRRPEYLAQALAMVRQMEKLAEDTVDGILVQSHGQYRPIHVFVGDSSISVVDMDRSRPCDPAYDVVEFIHRLRKTTFKCTGSVEPADAPTRAFLQTYSPAIPDRSYLTNLRFHWARFIFHSLNHEVKDAADENTESEAIVAFCRSEFENVIEGRFGIQEGAFDY